MPLVAELGEKADLGEAGLSAEQPTRTGRAAGLDRQRVIAALS